MQNAGLVFFGGGLGAVCRYLVTTQIGARFGTMFPWGTLSVNLLGSLLMGWILGLILLLTERTGSGLGEAARLLLTVGFLGGFTTFSSFSMETLTLLRGGSFFYALANIGMNVILGLLAAWLGLSLSRML
ncbi:fluoride efflux transporter CrcB [Selenomonas sp. WCA-380-WT-3B 3/]|uniref:Fluoride-specific ion channel FluC n=2 Tax=Selenomonas montiformis TaxID=2652285 RepID=A0A6I2USE2_9FIRM|nr:fluoride efflux transporter CrcB [Selenomonas montiformis]